MAGIP
jgi:hypothetical protein